MHTYGIQALPNRLLKTQKIIAAFMNVMVCLHVSQALPTGNGIFDWYLLSSDHRQVVMMTQVKVK